MQLALIPPSSMKSSIQDGTINLMLPWQMRELPKDFIQEVVDQNYTILDNGAAEGRLASWNELRVIADMWEGVDEVVVPDKLGDAEFSIQNAREAEKLAAPLLERGIRLMAVVQGQNLAEVMKCAYAYAGMDHISVIGLPRCLNTQFMASSRSRLAESFASDSLLKDIPLHCLGSYYPMPVEVRALAALPNIRSMDTSMPWVYGIAQRLLTNQYPRRGLSRPDNYFNYEVDRAQREYSDKNVDIILAWAQAF